MHGFHAATRLIQIALFDGFDPLDVIAPYEVLWEGSQGEP